MASDSTNLNGSELPNIILVLLDDMGYSDIGCYGGEIHTPNIDKLAEEGVRFTQFYNTAKCSPSRASLLTGQFPHKVGMGIISKPERREEIQEKLPSGYTGDLRNNCVTMAEVLKLGGYSTYLSGKWHLTNSLDKRRDNWPTNRGFDHYYGNMAGSGSYFWPTYMMRDDVSIDEEVAKDKDFYYTDEISDNAINYIQDHVNSRDNPFFLYIAYTAPHWPLHAKPEDIEKYKGQFKEGWGVLRQKRLARMQEMGVLQKEWDISDPPKDAQTWESIPENEKEWQERRMEVYAAQISCVDDNIGRMIDTLKETGEYDNTLFIFLSDNGATREERSFRKKRKDHMININKAHPIGKDGKEFIMGNIPNIMPGPDSTHQSYGVEWGNLSNTPFRLFKNWVHEGGIATPLIFSWPRKMKEKKCQGIITHQPSQLVDIFPTILDITKFDYPLVYRDQKIEPLQGISLLPTIYTGDVNREKCLYWEHWGNCAIRKGKWKLVKEHKKDWELYDMNSDRTEIRDLSKKSPKIVKGLSILWNEWAKNNDVLQWKKVKTIIHPHQNVFGMLKKKLRKK
jgi:arylsulfatase A-like enzyme